MNQDELLIVKSIADNINQTANYAYDIAIESVPFVGLMEMIGIVITLVVSVIMSIIFYNQIKKDIDVCGSIFGSLMTGAVTALIVGGIMSFVIDALIKIYCSEYYVISKIVGI